MLKRLSFTNDQQPLLVPPPLGSPGLQSGPLTPLDAGSPRAGSPSTGSQPIVERTTLHKSLSALSALLVAFDEFRDVAGRLGKAEKKIAKAARELAVCFGEKVEGGARSEIILTALAASAGLFDSLSEVDIKHAKSVQKEYESVNDLAGRFFKKVAKEERAFDESLATLDNKVKKATTTYEQSRPRTRPSASDAQAIAASHDKYIASLSSLSSSIASLKVSHAQSLGDKRDKAVKEVGRVMCALAESTWKNRVEGTRRGGEKSGEVVVRGVWCESGMPTTAPVDEEQPAFDSLYSPPRQSPDDQQGQQAGAETPKADLQKSEPVGLGRIGSIMRGPRALPGGQQRTQLDTSYFTSNPGLPPNTYLVQLPSLAPLSPMALQPPNNFNAPPQASQSQPPSPSRSAVSSTPRTNDLQAPGNSPNAQAYSSVSRKGSGESLRSRQSRGDILQDEQLDDRRTRSPGRMLENGRREGEFDFSHTSGRDSVVDDDVRSSTGRSRPWMGRDDEQRYDRDGKDSQAGGAFDSTASERSFVARMRDKYAEEKERERDDRSRADERRDAHEPRLPRSNSRVSTLAQRYAVASPPSHSQTLPPSSPGTPRPSHRYSQSMQPVYRTADTGSEYNEFGQQESRAPTSNWGAGSTRHDSPPLTRPSFPGQARSYSRQSLDMPSAGRDNFNSFSSQYSQPQRQASRPPSRQEQYQQQSQQQQPRASSRQGQQQSSLDSEPHSSVCGCESCSATHYGKMSSGTQEEEERRQKEYRSAGRPPAGERRMSMPIAFGGKR